MVIGKLKTARRSSVGIQMIHNILPGVGHWIQPPSPPIGCLGVMMLARQLAEAVSDVECGAGLPYVMEAVPAVLGPKLINVCINCSYIVIC